MIYSYFRTGRQNWFEGRLSAAIGLFGSLLMCAIPATGQNPLKTDPTVMNFKCYVNGPAPALQTLAVSTPIPGLSFTASTTTTSGGNWLTILPGGGTTPAGLSVFVGCTGLSSGSSYNGQIVLSGGGSSITVPVTMDVDVNRIQQPAPVAFIGLFGGAPPKPQQVALTSPLPGINFSVSASTNNGINWLAVTPASGTTQATVTASVDTTGLVSGHYTGNISVTDNSNGPSGSFNISVTLDLPSTFITASPNPVNFFALPGTSPAPQNMSITATTATGTKEGFAFGVVAATVNGGNWLQASAGSGVTTGTIAMKVDSANIAPGSYDGSITITAPNTGNSPLVVPVKLCIGTGCANRPVLAPKKLVFSFVSGGTQPADQNVTITSSDATQLTLSYSAVATTSDGANWLKVAPSAGVTPDRLTVSVNPSVIAKPGVYTGTITATGGSGSDTVDVTFTVGTTFSAIQPITLNTCAGATQPTTQSIALASVPVGTNFSVAATTTTPAGSNWLQVSPTTGTTNMNIAVSANPSVPSVLGVGTYSGSIVVTASGAINSPFTVPVTLSVGNACGLSVSQPSLSFTYTGGPDPNPQSVTVTSATPGATFTTSAQVTTPSGGAWLKFSPAGGTTTASPSISVSPAGLQNGTYTGTVTFTPTGSAASGLIPAPVKVTLTVNANSISASPNPVDLTYQFNSGAPASTQDLAITSTLAAVDYSLTVANPQPPPPTGQTTSCTWLTISSSKGTTPGKTTVVANASGLAAVNYPCYVTLTTTPATAVTNPSTNILVTLHIVGTVLTPSPTSLVFRYTSGSPVSPGQQCLNITSNPSGVSYSASAGISDGPSNWLQVTGGGTTPSGPTATCVSINPSVLSALIVTKQTSYTGTITLSSSGATPNPVPVTLIVDPPTTLTFVPNPLPVIIALNRTLPPGTKVAASGGVIPLTYTLPNPGGSGLTMNDAGVLGGTLSGCGVWDMTVQVTDAAKTAPTASLKIVAGPLLTITGLSNPIGAASPQTIGITFPAACNVPVNGVLTMGYTTNLRDDPNAKFGNGLRTIPWTVPAGSTTATFTGSSAMQVGTVAAGITLSASATMVSNGITYPVTPTANTAAGSINAAIPTITDVQASLAGSTITVKTTGYSTTRELQNATITFNFSTNQGPAPFSESMATIANITWYGSANSTPWGSQFIYTRAFTVNGGSPADISNVAVILTNQQGPTQAYPQTVK